MPFSRPTLADLISRVTTDIQSGLSGALAWLRRTFVAAFAKALAGIAHSLYGYVEWAIKQLFPDTADEYYLLKHCAIWKVDRKLGDYAAGNLGITGTDGYTVPAGTLVLRADGVEFTTDADVTIASGAGVCALTASDIGTAGNTAAGTTLSFEESIEGIDPDGTVDVDGLTGGTDTESLDSLLSRLLLRIQNPPHGGTSEDYENWALEVAGVTRAWPFPAQLGLGTVGLAFMMDDTYSDGIPAAGDVTTLQTYIDALRPVTAQVTVYAPIAVPQDFTIQLTPSDADTEAAVEAELLDLIQREAEPGGTLLLSHINEAISTATGETDHVLVSPVADITNDASHITTLGNITWS